MSIVVSGTVQCDKCRKTLNWYQKMQDPDRYSISISKMSKWVRDMGWSVGKTVKCPECKE